MPSRLRKLWKWLAGAFATLVIMLAVAVGLFRLLLPQVPAYHAQIESWASQAVGLPVRLGRLDARWSFGGPELTFENARLFTREREHVLIEASGGSVGIRFGDLLKGGKISPGKVVLSGTRLSLERNESGVLHLTGQEPAVAGARRAMAPVFQVLPRGVFEFREASLLYVDHSAGHGPWRFSNVELLIDHGRGRLMIEGGARLPAILGEEVEFKLSTRDPLQNPLAIRWQASLRAEQLNLEGLGTLLPAGMPAITGGRVDLVSNLGMVGRSLKHVSADVSLTDFFFSAGPDQAQGWQEIEGLIEWERQASGWKASASNLVVARAGRSWPASRLTVERTASGNQAVEILYMDASYLRLEDLKPVAGWLPEGDIRSMLEELDPEGEVRDLVVNRSLRDGRTVSYALRSELSGLTVQARGGMPGAVNLSGRLRMDDAGGYLELDTRDALLRLPALYEEPVAVDAALGSVNWHQDKGGWHFSGEGLEIVTPAFAAETRFVLTLPGEDRSPVLDLESSVTELDLAEGRAFLPDRKLPPLAYRWLQGALVSGRAPAATVTFQGPLRAYPFRGGEGRFSVRTVIQDMRFAFARDWPAIEGARFELVFENARLGGRIISGSMSGNDVSGSTAEIADLAEGVLILNGQSRGTVSDLLSFMRESPLAGVLGERINDVRGVGGAQTDLVVNLPLRQMEAFRVNGNTAVQAEWLGLEGLPQRFTQLRGEINFTEKAVRGSGIDARLFGREVSLDVRPGSNDAGVVDATLVEIQGRHSSTNLIDNLPFPVPVVMNGETAWTATARFPKASTSDQPFSVSVRSGLAGMEISLPEPVFKPAAETRPIMIDLTFPAAGQIVMTSGYGNILTSISRFLKQGEDWRHDRSLVNLGGPVPSLPPTEGLMVTGAADQLAMDGWLSVDWGESEDADVPPLLRSVNMRVNRLVAYGQVVPEARVKLDRNAREWLAQIDSDRVEGSLLIPADLEGEDPVFADMVRLVLMPDVRDGESGTTDPRDLPAMRITAAEFAYDDMNFGTLQAVVERTPYGLSLNSLTTRDPGFTVDGSGRWEVINGEESSQFSMSLKASDVRRTLVQLGFDPVMTADEASVTATVSWPGPPDRHFREKISGNVKVAVGDGQLLEVEPGAGRMFGLMSIAALPRRLSLDFRDVFDTGFGFDSITGDFELAEGQAYTSNLVLKGPAADIGIAGRAGIAERDYDQTAAVRANFGSALPVAGAIAGGPAVGAALLIFSEILKDPLKDMSKVFYRVTGSWDDPQIRRVDQALADAPAVEDNARPEDPGGG